MSSDRIERKRRSDFDTSDSSADELPAVKIRKLDSKISLRKKVSEACKNFFDWITPEFVRKMAVKIYNSRSSTSLKIEESNHKNQHLIDVDNDEEECVVVGVQNGTGVHSRSTQELRKDTLSTSTKSSNSSICDLTTTPCFPLSPDNPFYKKASLTMERRKMNGFPGRAETGREDLHRLKRNEKCIAPITNPRCEIDILLEKDKEIEIINEVYPAKQSPGPTRKPRLFSDTRSSNSDYITDFTNYCLQSNCFSKSYTANEVVRLQEKAQYSLLLEKVVKRTPLFQPAILKKRSEVSALQVDLTEDKPASYHFKKEKVEENVTDFLKKYYKPCNLFSPSSKVRSRVSHTPNTSEKETRKDDNNIEIDYPELPRLIPRQISKNDIFSEEWLKDLRQSVTLSTEMTLLNVSENEKKVLRFKKRREAKNAEEMRKREELRLGGFIFPEDVEMEEEALPEITPEMEAIIEFALNPDLPDDIVICEFKTKRDCNEITRADMVSLTGLSWLNDQVINFYCSLIESRSVLDGYPTAIVFNSFFYPKLKRVGPCRQVLRWTRKFDIFAVDLIVVPLHLEMHWALLVVDNRKKTIKYYDSMQCQEPQSLNIVHNYLKIEMKDKKNVELEPYALDIAVNIPKQENGSDCGMFTLKYAEYLSRDASLTFTQNNMPYFRRRMIYELMAKQIL